MFTRPALYHPYRPTTPRASPAGFRTSDYAPRRCFNLFASPDFTTARSPAPTPMSSPLKGTSDDDAPPVLSLADQFAKDFGSPFRPSTPTPVDRRNVRATPKANDADIARDPPLNPVRGKDKRRRPKHLSFNKSAIRPGIVPLGRRTKQSKERRSVRKRPSVTRDRSLVRVEGSFSTLCKEAKALMKPVHMDDADRIFLDQLAKLELELVMDRELDRCRKRVARAAAEAPKRRREHEQRDLQVARVWKKRSNEEALAEQKKMVAEFVRSEEDRKAAHHRRVEEAAMRTDEERQRKHEMAERRIREEQERLFHETLTRKAKEEEARRRREEKERRLKEERERRQREERERRLREYMERQQREEKERQKREERMRRQQEERERRLREERAQEEMERKMREELERCVREARERLLREEQERLAKERERQAYLAREERERQAYLAEQARLAAQNDQRIHHHFALYEGKWHELRTSTTLPIIDVMEMPWPVFGIVSCAEQVTYQDVRTFLFHPLRPGVEGKSARDKVKTEVLRFHPDKFNARILPKIHPAQQEVARAIAGAVARILTRIMTEEVEQQK